MSCSRRCSGRGSGNTYVIPDIPRLEARKTLLALEPGAMGRAVLAAAERHSPCAARAAGPSVRPNRGDAHLAISERGGLDHGVLAEVPLRAAARRALRPAPVSLVPPAARAQGAREADPDADRTGRGRGGPLAAERGRTVRPGDVPQGDGQAGPRLGARGSPAADPIDRRRRRHATWRPARRGAEAVNDDLAASNRRGGCTGSKLLEHALTATAARPSSKWLEGGPEARGCDRRRRRPRETPAVVPPGRAGGTTIGKLPHSRRTPSARTT